MARTKRFELVLSDEEYEQLERVATAEGLSKGALVRKVLFGHMGDDLEINFKVDREMEKLADLGPAPKVVRQALEQPPTPTAATSEMDLKLFKQKVARLQGRQGMSQEEAERKVREELG